MEPQQDASKEADDPVTQWSAPGNGSTYDQEFSRLAEIECHTRPSFNGKEVSDRKLQMLGLAPSDAYVAVWLDEDRKDFGIFSEGSRFIRKGEYLQTYIGNENGKPFLEIEHVMLDNDAPAGFGAVALWRCAQAAQSLGFSHIELMAAGGASYKHGSPTRSDYNGYYSWPRFGFDAELYPATKALLKGKPGLESCTTLLELIECDASWWKDNGSGCMMTFDLAEGSRSWHTLVTYLQAKGYRK